MHGGADGISRGLEQTPSGTPKLSGSLRLDFGFIATILRKHFGVEYLASPDPHPCLSPDCPNFDARRNQWKSLPLSSFSPYARELWDLMKRSKEERTAAGLVASILEEVIRSQDPDLLLSQAATDSPAFEWDMLMVDILACVLRFMCHCRRMLLRGIPLTHTHLATYAPSGNGESPRGAFALHPLFLRNEFYYFLHFPSSVAYETYYEQFQPLPQDYPTNGRFLAPDAPPLQEVSCMRKPFIPVPPLKIGTKFAALLEHPREEISIAGQKERRSAAEVCQDDHQVPVEVGQSCLFSVGGGKWEYRSVEERVLQELNSPGPLSAVSGEDSPLTRWNLILTELQTMTAPHRPQDWTDEEWDRFQREHPDPPSVTPGPTTSAGPFTSPLQPVIPVLSPRSHPDRGRRDRGFWSHRSFGQGQPSLAPQALPPWYPRQGLARVVPPPHDQAGPCCVAELLPSVGSLTPLGLPPGISSDLPKSRTDPGAIQERRRLFPGSLLPGGI